MDATTSPDQQARIDAARVKADAKLAAKAAAQRTTQPPAPEAPDQMQARIDAALAKADAKLAARQAGTVRPDGTSFSEPPALEPGLGDPSLSGPIAGGIAKAAIETKDFLVGQPAEANKSDFRKNVEGTVKSQSEQSAGYGLTSGVAQMVTGLVGAGKFLKPFQAAQKLAAGGKVAKFSLETGKAALASTVVLDPHEERLSDFIEQFPSLQNPVTQYLATDPNDSAAEGRFKNAIESLGVDLALVGVVKAMKFFRAGDAEAGVKEIKKLEAAQSATQATPAAAKDAPVAAPGAPQAAASEAAAPASTIEQIGTKQPLDAKGNPVLPTAPVDPKTVAVKGIADADIESILKGVEGDREAIAKFGTREEAIAEGHKFGGEVSLPWQKLHTEGGAAELIDRTTTVLAHRYNLAKGGAVLSDSRVASTVNEIADLYGEDPAMVMGQIAQAGEAATMMAPRMEAALRLGNKMFQDAEDLRVKITNGDLRDFNGDPKQAAQEWMGRLAISLDTLASGNSILSNAGRTLRRARGEFRFKPEDLARFRAMDPAKAMLIVEKANGDLKKVTMLMNEKWTRRVMNEATWHMTNGLLWLWPTHLVNTTTNAFMLAARPTEKLFGSAALRLITKDPGRRAELSSVSRQALREYAYTVTSLADGWANAVEAFKKGDSILNPHNTEFFDGGTGISAKPLRWRSWNNVVDIAANAYMAANYRTIVGLPTRALGGADEFFKTLRYRAVVQSKAAVEAADRGLEGEAARRYVQNVMDKAIEPSTGLALDRNALAEAQKTTFQQDLGDYDTWVGSAGQAVQNARKTFSPLGLVVPFIKTPVNVLRYGLKMTPGLNLLQKEYVVDLMGKTSPEAQAHAVGQMAVGSLFMGLAAHLAVNDRFTGGGPRDPELKQALMATGWKPYSLPMKNEDGTTDYVQLGRFDPAAMAMGMVADIVALRKKNPEEDYSSLMLAATLAIAKNLSNKTFLLNLDSAIGAMMEPEKQGGKFAGRTLGAMVPLSSLIRGHNPDPYMREARGLIDAAMAGIPGLSTKLPITMDVFGDPVERHLGVTDQASADLVEAEHNRIMLQTDKGIGKPATKFESVDLRDITLVDGKNAYQRLQELSGHLPNGAPSLKAVLAKIIQSPGYQDLPDGDSDVQGTRLFVLGKATQQYREKAKKYLVIAYPELQPLVKARQREVRGAILKNRAAAPGGQELLKALSNTGGK